jgi:hypothetical protein
MPPTVPAARGKDVGTPFEDFRFAWEASGNGTKPAAMNLEASQVVTNVKSGRHVGGLNELARECHFWRSFSKISFLEYAWKIVPALN